MSRSDPVDEVGNGVGSGRVDVGATWFFGETRKIPAPIAITTERQRITINRMTPQVKRMLRFSLFMSANIVYFVK